jgi:hypothetical protein
MYVIFVPTCTRKLIGCITAVIMRTTYGIKIQKQNDKYIEAAEQMSRYLDDVITPGRFWVKCVALNCVPLHLLNLLQLLPFPCVAKRPFHMRPTHETQCASFPNGCPAPVSSALLQKCEPLSTNCSMNLGT